MRILNTEGIKHHMNPANNYLLRTNGAFARGEASVEIIDPSRIAPESIDVITDAELIDAAIETAPDEDSAFDTVPEELSTSLQIVEKAPIGRGANNTNIPTYLKSAMAELAQTGVKKTDIANAFNVSAATVTHASRGREVNGDVIPEIQDKLQTRAKIMQEQRETIEQTALAKTLSALGILTEDDIECLGAKDKADVAMKLSKVAENMRPRGDAVNDNRIQVIINAPQVREHVQYDEVEV